MIASPWAALLWGAAIGTLGGLIGLGGAEFRLPVLLGLFALVAHHAVRMNLLMSLVTLAASAVGRFGFASFPDLAAHLPEIMALTIFAMATAWFGAGLLARINAQSLTRLISVLLAAISVLLCRSRPWLGRRCTSALPRVAGGGRLQGPSRVS